MSTFRVTAPLWRFLKNPYPRPENHWLHNHIPGQEVNNTNNIIREDKQHFFPKENKTSNHLLQLSDFIKDATEELKKIFHEKWINQIIKDKTGNKYSECKLALVNQGYSEEQAKDILNYAAGNIERIKNWAYDNEKVGKVASTFMSFAIPLGIIRNVISGIETIPTLIHRIVSFAYVLTSSLRGFYQYSKHVYDRPDDEASMNRYQAEVYGNKIAGGFGTLACLTETKVNPLVLPAVAALSSKKEVLDSTFSILTIPNISWWRARMPAHINQEYLTDLLRYFWHKPLSLFGVKSSKKVVQDIKERGNIDLSYITRRHYENLGIKDPGEQRPGKFISELFKNIKNSFNRDIKVQLESARKVGETIAPLFGFTAFISTIIGTPLRVIFRLFDKENKIIDFFNSLSISCQQFIYLFKMVIPAIWNVRKTKNTLLEQNLDKKLSGSEIEDLKLLLAKYKKLSFLGLATFFSSITNSVLKLFKFENSHFEKAKSAVEGLAGDLVSKFFSERRHVLGFQFKAENPEFYEEEEQVAPTSEGKKIEEATTGNNGELLKKTVVIRAIQPLSQQEHLQVEDKSSSVKKEEETNNE